MVRLDRGREVSWPELRRLEMLPVLRLVWLGLEVETEVRDLVGEELTPVTGRVNIWTRRVTCWVG